MAASGAAGVSAWKRSLTRRPRRFDRHPPARPPLPTLFSQTADPGADDPQVHAKRRRPRRSPRQHVARRNDQTAFQHTRHFSYTEIKRPPRPRDQRQPPRPRPRGMLPQSRATPGAFLPPRIRRVVAKLLPPFLRRALPFLFSPTTGTVTLTSGEIGRPVGAYSRILRPVAQKRVLRPAGDYRRILHPVEQ